MLEHVRLVIVTMAVLVTPGCGGDDSSASDAGVDARSGFDGGVDGGMAVDAGPRPDTGPVLCDQLPALVAAYKAAHPGNGGKDWDINALSLAEIAADPAAQQLLAVCGDDQRPVFPLLAWEYGGLDHPWINPDASALVYCVYIPVGPSTDNWAYDATADHVTADVYIPCPDQNPCNDRVGASQVSDCIGDSSNLEILVDTASRHDGVDVGLSLSEASTELRLVLGDGTKVHLYDGL